MITNLIATVLISVVTTTNDIPRWTSQEYQAGRSSLTMYIDEASEGTKFIDVETGKTNIIRFPNGPGMKNGNDERVRIVSEKRIVQLEFMWNGRSRKITEEEILSERRIILKKIWEESK